MLIVDVKATSTRSNRLGRNCDAGVAKVNALIRPTEKEGLFNWRLLMVLWMLLTKLGSVQLANSKYVFSP